MSHDLSVAAQLARLPELSMPDLWVLWDRHFEQRPRHNNRDYLQSRLAYQIQAKAYGELSAATKHALEKIGEAGTATHSSRTQTLMPGLTLVREHGGIEHRVLVKGDGSCEYGGRIYRSLSAVARAITGTRWNGWVFFGLKNRRGQA